MLRYGSRRSEVVVGGTKSLIRNVDLIPFLHPLSLLAFILLSPSNDELHARTAPARPVLLEPGTLPAPGARLAGALPLTLPARRLGRHHPPPRPASPDGGLLFLVAICCQSRSTDAWLCVCARGGCLPSQLDEIYGAPESFLEIEVRSPQTHGTSSVLFGP